MSVVSDRTVDQLSMRRRDAGARGVADLTPECADDLEMTPGQTLGLVRQHRGPVLVDLDETLYLRNSTEDFIDLARPALLAFLLLRVVEILKPWRLTGGIDTRDVWRVRIVCLLFPGTVRRWQTEVDRLAAHHVNEELMQALRHRGSPPIVVTLGFTPVVVPLVRALGLPHVRVISCRSSTFADRRRGKLELAREALGDAHLRNSMLITDSEDDRALLDTCAVGALVRWPEARYRRAHAGLYVPGQYIELIKHPGARYFRRGVLQEEYPLWILSSIGLAPFPLLHSAALLLLLLSFWTIYEAGYVDNDNIAAKLEASPTLTSAFHDEDVARPRWQPWIWAAAFGAAGLFTLRAPGLPTWGDGVRWGGVLLATFGWFGLYNRSDKRSRTWMYMPLQVARAAAFTLLVPVTLVGSMALAAHALTRCIPYYLYRVTGKEWPRDFPLALSRLATFVVLGLFCFMSSPPNRLFTWSALCIAAWYVFCARRGLLEVYRRYRFRWNFRAPR